MPRPRNHRPDASGSGSSRSRPDRDSSRSRPDRDSGRSRQDRDSGRSRPDGDRRNDRSSSGSDLRDILASRRKNEPDLQVPAGFGFNLAPIAPIPLSDSPPRYFDQSHYSDEVRAYLSPSRSPPRHRTRSPLFTHRSRSPPVWGSRSPDRRFRVARSPSPMVLRYEEELRDRLNVRNRLGRQSPSPGRRSFSPPRYPEIGLRDFSPRPRLEASSFDIDPSPYDPDEFLASEQYRFELSRSPRRLSYGYGESPDRRGSSPMIVLDSYEASPLRRSPDSARFRIRSPSPRRQRSRSGDRRRSKSPKRRRSPPRRRSPMTTPLRRDQSRSLDRKRSRIIPGPASKMDLPRPQQNRGVKIEGPPRRSKLEPRPNVPKTNQRKVVSRAGAGKREAMSEKPTQHLINSQREEIEALMRQQEALMPPQNQEQVPGTAPSKSSAPPMKPIMGEPDSLKSLTSKSAPELKKPTEKLEPLPEVGVELSATKVQDVIEQLGWHRGLSNDAAAASKESAPRDVAADDHQPQPEDHVSPGQTVSAELPEGVQSEETPLPAAGDFIEEADEDEVTNLHPLPTSLPVWQVVDDDGGLEEGEVGSDSGRDIHDDGDESGNRRSPVKDLRSYLNSRKGKKPASHQREPSFEERSRPRPEGGHRVKSTQSCFNCLQFGHSFSNCPFPSNKNTDYNDRPQSSAPEAPQMDQDHVIQEMLTRLRNESTKIERPRCVSCGGHSHDVRRCPNIPCDRCHESDHVSADCQGYQVFAFCQLCKHRHRTTECTMVTFFFTC